jgi:DNA replication protein DnaD
MKPTFVDEKEMDRILISRHLKFDEAFIVEDGVLELKELDEHTRNLIVDVYKINNIDANLIFRELYSNIGREVDNNFIYETIYNKKSYSKDQIFGEENVTKVNSYNTELKLFKENVTDYFLRKICEFDEESIRFYHFMEKNIKNGGRLICM